MKLRHIALWTALTLITIATAAGFATQNVAGSGNLSTKQGSLKFAMDVTRFESGKIVGSFEFASGATPVLGIVTFRALTFERFKFAPGETLFTGVGIADFGGGQRRKLNYSVYVRDNTSLNGTSDFIEIMFLNLPNNQNTISGTVDNGDVMVSTRF